MWFRNQKSSETRRERARQPAQGISTASALAADPEKGAPSVAHEPDPLHNDRRAPPFFLLEARPMTAQRCFEDSVRGSVSERVTQYRSDKGLDRHQHPGLLKSELSKRWKTLTDDEKEHWEQEALRSADKVDEDQLTG